MPLACCSDSSSSEDEYDEEGADFKDGDGADCNANDDGVSFNEDAENCGGYAHEGADASFDGGGELGSELGGGSTEGVAATGAQNPASSSGSPASRQAAIWRRLKRKHPGSQWVPATQRAS